jgi:ribonuclease HI
MSARYDTDNYATILPVLVPNEPLEYTHYGWTDGACDPKNPGGTATAGMILKKAGETLFADYRIIGSGSLMSNNVAEHAAMADLLYLIYTKCAPGDAVLIRTDSMLVVKQLCGKWKVKRGLYIPEFKRGQFYLENCRDIGITIDIQWVPREQNEEADALTKKALSVVGIKPTKYKKKKVRS